MPRSHCNHEMNKSLSSLVDNDSKSSRGTHKMRQWALSVLCIFSLYSICSTLALHQINMYYSDQRSIEMEPPTFDSDPIHILITVCNGGRIKIQKSMRRYREAVGLLRTIQRYGMYNNIGNASSERIVVHIFTDNVITLTEQFLQASPTSKLIDRLDVRVYEMPPPSKSEDYNKHRTCASARLYAPRLFQSSINSKRGGVGDYNSSSIDRIPERILYLDTDTLVTTPLRKLWDSATAMFDKQQNALFAMTQEVPVWARSPKKYEGENVTGVGGETHLIYKFPRGTREGYNSGVLFMHLHRWQLHNFSAMVSEQESFALNHNYTAKMKYGDQGILNAMSARFPERLLELPCFWNMRGDSMEACLPRYIDNGGGILHGNKGRFRCERNCKVPEWSVVLHDYLVRDNDTVYS